MADISSVTLPSGTTYNLKDAAARADIASIQQAIAGGLKFLGETTTALTDGATTNPITINGDSVTAVAGNLVLYGDKEFLFDGTKWIEMGDLSLLGALAYKNSASGSFTPSGSVSAPSISVASAGSTTTVNSITDVGTAPAWTATVANETLTIGWSAGTLPTKGADTTVKTGDASYSASQPSFTGTAGTVTVS
ncbi:MAG: hypothetical protein J6T26_04810 [Firmicutes bacterium]|nr:hypothetical protein [Bacillota bacterium]